MVKNDTPNAVGCNRMYMHACRVLICVSVSMFLCFMLVSVSMHVCMSVCVSMPVSVSVSVSMPMYVSASVSVSVSVSVPVPVPTPGRVHICVRHIRCLVIPAKLLGIMTDSLETKGREWGGGHHLCVEFGVD